MSVIRTFRKATTERKRLYVDYDCWLAATEQLTGFLAVVIPYTADAPLVLDASYPDVAQRKLMVYVSGGAENTSYTVRLRVNTSEGQVKRDEIGVRVFP